MSHVSNLPQDGRASSRPVRAEGGRAEGATTSATSRISQTARVSQTSGPRSSDSRPNGAQGLTAKGVQRTRLPFPVILFLLTVVVPLSFKLGPLTMTTLRLLLMILILPLIVNLLTGKYGKIFVTDILFLVFMGWATLALAMTSPNKAIEQMGSVGVEFLGGYLMGRAYIRTPESFAALARWLIGIICVLLPFAAQEALTGRPMLLEILGRVPGMTSQAVVNIPGRLGLERVQAVFAHPIHFGLFCSMAFSLAFIALKSISSGPWRWFSSALMAFSGFLALSSGAFLALILQGFLILWAAIFAQHRRRWWYLVGLFAAMYVVIDLLSNRSPIQVFMSYATFSAQTAYWRSIIFEWGMINMWAHPVFGLGMNDWVRPPFMRSSSIDNFWLVTAIRYGFPGAILLILGYGAAVAQIMRRNLEGDVLLGQFRQAWVFTFLGLAFTLSTVHIWTNIYSFVFFMFGAGMWLIQTPAQSDTTGTAATQGTKSSAGRRALAKRGPSQTEPAQTAQAQTAESQLGAQPSQTVPELTPPEPTPEAIPSRYSRFPVQKGRKPAQAVRRSQTQTGAPNGAPSETPNGATPPKPPFNNVE